MAKESQKDLLHIISENIPEFTYEYFIRIVGIGYSFLNQNGLSALTIYWSHKIK